MEHPIKRLLLLLTVSVLAVNTVYSPNALNYQTWKLFIKLLVQQCLEPLLVHVVVVPKPLNQPWILCPCHHPHQAELHQVQPVQKDIIIEKWEWVKLIDNHSLLPWCGTQELH